MRKTVAFGFVGTVLDYVGRGSQRWEKVATNLMPVPAGNVSRSSF